MMAFLLMGFSWSELPDTVRVAGMVRLRANFARDVPESESLAEPGGAMSQGGTSLRRMGRRNRLSGRVVLC